MELNLNFVHSAQMGYGRLGTKLEAALTARGVEVYDYLPCPPGAVPFDPGIEDRHAGVAGSACWVSTPPQAFGWWDTQVPSIFTMWEATRLPESFRENLHHFETVIVPSAQNVELFSRYHPNVQLVHLGVDPADWHYVERTVPGQFFEFLIGGSGTRKGTDIAFAAFKAAFPTATADAPIPRLTFKNPRGEDFSFDNRVRVIPAKISATDEQDLYASSHCYLQPSRGEGFGLQPLQALAQGMPTILTDAHGHEAFAHLGHGVGYTMSKSAYFIYGDAGDWWEPNLDDVVDQMRWVYDNYDAACDKARHAAAVIAQDFTWDRTAEQFMAHVDCTLPYAKGQWFTPDRLKYRIRLKDRRVVDIAGRVMRFEPETDYWELADVKRVLAEAGCLTQDCIDEEDSGLADVQIARLAKGDNDLTRWHAGV